MLELKALLLTQGMHGMVSQVEGLAKALGLSYKHQKIELKSFWNFIPPKISPISEKLVKNKFVCDCKVIISCGRKSVIPSIYLKKKFKNKIMNIHIQDPKVSLNNFDFVIVGSDQIWNIDLTKGENSFYGGSTNSIKTCNWITYAVSVGHCNYDENNLKIPSSVSKTDQLGLQSSHQKW